MAISYLSKKVEINGIELSVHYTLYSEEETNYSEIEEIRAIMYNGRDITELIDAFDLEEQIQELL